MIEKIYCLIGIKVSKIKSFRLYSQFVDAKRNNKNFELLISDNHFREQGKASNIHKIIYIKLCRRERKLLVIRGYLIGLIGISRLIVSSPILLSLEFLQTDRRHMVLCNYDV